MTYAIAYVIAFLKRLVKPLSVQSKLSSLLQSMSIWLNAVHSDEFPVSKKKFPKLSRINNQ